MLTVPNQPPGPDPKLSQDRRERRTKIAIVAAITFGLSTIILYITVMIVLTHFHQAQSAIVTNARALRKARRYPECIAEAKRINPFSSVFYLHAQRIADDCQRYLILERFDQATRFAKAGQVIEAALLIANIPPAFLNLNQKQFVEELSTRLLSIARTHYYQPLENHLQRALDTIKQIPAISSVWEEAQERAGRWQAEFDANQAYLRAAQIALNEGNLNAAERAIREISAHPFWILQVQSIQQTLDQMWSEREYANFLSRAYKHLEQGEPKNAIAIIHQIPDIYPWEERKQLVLRKAESMLVRQRICQLFYISC